MDSWLKVQGMVMTDGVDALDGGSVGSVWVVIGWLKME